MKSWASIVRHIEEPLKVLVREKEIPAVEITEEEYLAQIERIKQDIKKRETAFKNSYAYTKYLNDYETLHGEINKIKTKISDMHKKQEMDGLVQILERIIDYLGMYYTSNYETDTGYAMTYTIHMCAPSTVEVYSNRSKMGITWAILEQYRSIHIDFTVDTSEKSILLESLIKQILEGFTKKNESK